MIRTTLPPCGRRSRLGIGYLTTLGAVVGMSLGCDGGGYGDGTVGPRPDMAVVADRVTAAVEWEMEDKGLPALSMALVHGDQVVWARGFGLARPADSVPATAHTVYRVGSVSKLFTDLGIMQLVERGVLDLDAPVSTYLADFRPGTPPETAPTLRQLMSHRAGLMREPPVGNYFDDTEPSLAATIASLNGQPLIYPPGTRIKYSNAGIGVAGYVLEQVRQRPFSEYLEETVLRPLALEHSSFAPRPDLMRDLATGYMWTYDGRRFEAPNFQLGMAPAGNMYATVTDLAAFMVELFGIAGGKTDGVVGTTTLAEMWQPQFADPNATEGYGLGFRLSTLDGDQLVSHGGAIYGFATQLAMLPAHEVGVVVVTTLDGANTVVNRLATTALLSLRAATGGQSFDPPAPPSPVPDGVMRRVAGQYGTGRDVVHLLRRDDALYVWPRTDGTLARMKRLNGDTLVVDGRLDAGARLVPGDEGIEWDGRLLTRVPNDRPPQPAPARFRGLIGEYGWDHNVLYILEDGASLMALIEWFFLYPLREIATDRFAFPDAGLYHGEELEFVRNPESGRVTGVVAAGVSFARRAVAPDDGTTFTIEPQQPVDLLRTEALAATPPQETGLRQPELVELITLDPTIRLDIRYAGTNNFMSSPMYTDARAFLQRPAAEALVRVHQRLAARGLGLWVFDAYRPWFVTKMFWDATPDSMKIFVADPARGSRHNRGSAVDLTLFDRATGQPVEMVGGYDEFSPRSFPHYPGGTARQRWYRETLRAAMEIEGFAVYEFEWWHFDFQDWAAYPILNIPFEDIGGP